MNLSLLPSRTGTRPLFLKKIDRVIYDTSAGAQLASKKAAQRKQLFRVVLGVSLACLTLAFLARR